MSGLRYFGTDGVRGLVNEDFTPDFVADLARALGSTLPEGSRVALGRDARTSSPMFAAAATAGLASTGVHVVDLGISPTPAIQFYTGRHPDIAAGVIITASHNPPAWNGLKYIAKDGTEASRDDEEKVEALLVAKKFRRADWSKIGGVAPDPSANPDYVAAVLSHVDRDAIRGRRFKVVVDAGGGPGAITTPQLLESLGCTVVPLHCELDGTFSGRHGEPVEENLSKLKAKVGDVKADLGVAHDGDADRAIFVDERGSYVPGDQSFAILAKYIHAQAKGGVLCTPVSTSSLVDEVVRESGGRTIYTAVGSPIVGRRMRVERATFGGEENGGLIFPQHQYCRDGLMATALMLEVLARRRATLSALRAELPRYTVTKSKFECPNPKKKVLTEQIKSWIRASSPTAKVDETDGLKVYFDDGWVLARPSGTEPVFRIYAESRSPERSKALADQFVAESKRIVARL